ncbi:MAG: hypothetical protein ABIQ95_08995 [Bdellovibrionia bacterium]
MLQKTKNILDCVKGISFGASLTGIGIFLFNSCGPKPTIPTEISSLLDPLLNNGIAVSTAGTVTDTSFYVALVPTLPGSYKIHATDTSLPDPTVGLFTKPCQILPTTLNTSPDADIKCIVEGEELDLWFNGMELNYNIPPALCSYFTVDSYYYYAAQPGKGPTATSYTIQLDGTTTNTSPAYPVTSDGKPACKYNYEGRNCCEGKYVATVSTVQPAPSPAITSTISGDWGGKASNCLSGPALDFGSKGTTGYPQGTIALVEGKGANGVLKITAPAKKSLKSNIYVANYFDPAPLPTPKMPTAMAAQAGGFGATSPYYKFSCLDRAFDIRARIRVQIREWNEVSEFEKSNSGDPNTGQHGVFFDGEAYDFSSVDYNPGFNNGYPVNRLLDWDDLEFFSLSYPATSATALKGYYPGGAYPQSNE